MSKKQALKQSESSKKKENKKLSEDELNKTIGGSSTISYALSLSKLLRSNKF